VYDFIVEVPHNMVSLNIYQHVLSHNVFSISVWFYWWSPSQYGFIEHLPACAFT